VDKRNPRAIDEISEMKCLKEAAQWVYTSCQKRLCWRLIVFTCLLVVSVMSSVRRRQSYLCHYQLLLLWRGWCNQCYWPVSHRASTTI